MIFLFYRIFTSRKRSLGQGNIFTPVCHSVHTGAACVVGGMQGRGQGGKGQGACMVGGAWQGGHMWRRACMVGEGSMCGRGLCLVGGMHGRGGMRAMVDTMGYGR